jgi:hypothetical protein
MSIQALQMRVAERTSQMARPTQSAVAISGAVTAAGAATATSRFQDQVQLSDQARKLSASLGQAEVELQLSPEKLREMMGPAAPVSSPQSE